MNATCNWAILGTGIIARKFAAALAHVPGARLVAVLSRDSARGEDFAAAFAAAASAPPAAALTSLAEVLADPEIRIVYIATPNHLHAEQAIACLSAGKAVICEKPLALDAGEARAVAAAATASGQFCMEAMWTLCLPALDKVRALVSDGRIGRIRMISGTLSYARSYDPDDRFFNPALGGGVLLDLGVYPLALALSLLGQPREIQGIVQRAANGIDLQSSIALGFDGAMASLSCGFAAAGHNAMVITGEDGILELQSPLNAPALLSLTPSPPARPYGADQSTSVLPVMRANTMAAMKQMLRPLKPGRTRLYPVPFRGNGMIHQIEEAMACLRAGKTQSAKIPLALSVSVLEVIDQVKALNPAA